METKERRAPGKNRKPPVGDKKQSGKSKTAVKPKIAGKPKTAEKPKRPVKKPVDKTANTIKPVKEKRPVRKPAAKQPTPDVVYAQPAPFNRGRFVLGIAIAVAVALALVLGMAIFFQVDEEKIQVSGANKYSVEQIVAASGVKDGENLFAISEARVGSSIIAELPYVERVRVGIKLPDTVKIEIVELDVTYSIEDSNGGWWLLRSDGGVIEETNSAEAQRHTCIRGVKIQDPVVGSPAKAYQPAAAESENATAPITVYASEQLSAAWTIISYLEESRIIGEMTSIDVGNLGDIQMWYGDKYQILLGDTLELNYKIRTLKSTLDQMGDYQSGVLDISFTVWEDKVGYTPFA